MQLVHVYKCVILHVTVLPDYGKTRPDVRIPLVV